MAFKRLNPNAGKLEAAAQAVASRHTTSIPLSKLKSSPHNIDMPMDAIEALAEDIRKNGLHVPISVYDMKDGTYQIWSGHRRKTALDMIGKTSAECFVSEYPKSKETEFLSWLESNEAQRDKTAAYCSAVIKQTENYLLETDSDFVFLTVDQRVRRISSYLTNELGHSGYSVTNVYRYKSLEKRIPEFRNLETEYKISGLSLADVKSMDENQQMLFVEKVRGYAEQHPEAEITKKVLLVIREEVLRETSPQIEEDEQETKMTMPDESVTCVPAEDVIQPSYEPEPDFEEEAPVYEEHTELPVGEEVTGPTETVDVVVRQETPVAPEPSAPHVSVHVDAVPVKSSIFLSQLASLTDGFRTFCDNMVQVQAEEDRKAALDAIRSMRKQLDDAEARLIG